MEFRWKTESKKIFCFAFGALLFSLRFSGEAQAQAKVPKIGWLEPGPLLLQSLGLSLSGESSVKLAMLRVRT